MTRVFFRATLDIFVKLKVLDYMVLHTETKNQFFSIASCLISDIIQFFIDLTIFELRIFWRENPV